MYTGWEYIHLNIVYLVTNKFEVGTNIEFFFPFGKKKPISNLIKIKYCLIYRKIFYFHTVLIHLHEIIPNFFVMI